RLGGCQPADPRLRHGAGQGRGIRGGATVQGRRRGCGGCGVNARPQSPPPIDPRTIRAFAALISERRWVCWSWELDKKKEKWTKPPRQPGGAFAKNNDCRTSSTFEECWAVVQAGKAGGIGFMLMNLAGERLAAIDLDQVRNPDTGAL